MTSVDHAQPGILPPPRPHARYLTARLRDGVSDTALRAGLGALDVGDSLVAGLGPELARRLDTGPEAFHPFPDLSGHGVSVPSTQADLWLWVRGEAPGDPVLEGRALMEGLSDLFEFDPPTLSTRGRMPPGPELVAAAFFRSYAHLCAVDARGGG